MGYDIEISKDTMSEFFHTLSLQALSRSNNTIILNFNAVNKLNKSINSLSESKILTFRKKRNRKVI